MKKTKQISFLILICIFIMSSCFIYVFRNQLKKIYIITLHKNTIIEYHNDKGQLEGEYVAYLKGMVYLKAYFKNGLREGWCTYYNEKNWKKKDEVFYRHGKPEGVENMYYDNGNLNYTTHWKNGKYSLSQTHYLNNGNLNTYISFDESRNLDNGYCNIMYDSVGDFHQIIGHVFSPFIYSLHGDSLVGLIENHKYQSIKDMFINVATPPKLFTTVDVKINNVNFNNVIIKDNLVKIPNVFLKTGSYQITIYGKLINKNGQQIKADSLKTTIKVD